MTLLPRLFEDHFWHADAGFILDWVISLTNEVWSYQSVLGSMVGVA